MWPGTAHELIIPNPCSFLGVCLLLPCRVSLIWNRGAIITVTETVPGIMAGAVAKTVAETVAGTMTEALAQSVAGIVAGTVAKTGWDYGRDSSTFSVQLGVTYFSASFGSDAWPAGICTPSVPQAGCNLCPHFLAHSGDPLGTSGTRQDW